MLVLVIVLIVTNLVSLGGLAWFLLRPAEQPAPAGELTRSLEATLRPSVSSTGTRRLITIEILNPIEVAGTRGRLAGIAGSLAPGITRRIVHEQAVKMVRRQLAGERVVADVRLHQFRPPGSRPAGPRPGDTGPDEPVDLVKHPDDPDAGPS